MSKEEQTEIIDVVRRRLEKEPRERVRQFHNHDCSKPEMMVLEALLDEEIIESQDTRENGMLGYLTYVSYIVKEARSAQSKRIAAL